MEQGAVFFPLEPREDNIKKHYTLGHTLTHTNG